MSWFAHSSWSDILRFILIGDFFDARRFIGYIGSLEFLRRKVNRGIFRVFRPECGLEFGTIENYRIRGSSLSFPLRVGRCGRSWSSRIPILLEISRWATEPTARVPM